MIVPTIESSLTVQDKIRLHLESYGAKEIPVTIEDIANRVGLPRNSVYQGLHRLAQYNEIVLQKEASGIGKERIIGIKLIRLQPSGRTYRRAAARSNSRSRPVIGQLDFGTFSPDALAASIKDEVPALPKIVEYLEKKLAIEEMKATAAAAGLDESVIQFELDEIAEEGVLLLKLYTDLRNKYNDLKEKHQQLGFDLDAEKRNVEFLKNKLREETKEELLGIGNGNGSR